jgi:UDP-N-acetylmuramyl pentapeptide phosphotransferase/UDP-N-acetylglucosamine-1-phosphate transferase
MDIWSSLLISILLLLAALGLMYWHIGSWRKAQLADHNPDELDFYRRQFRRRIQTSAMLGILAVMIFAGEVLTWWISSHIFFLIYWIAALLLVVWVALLAGADIWATKYHFGQLRQKCLIEQAKLHAEIRRVQSVRGNGKPATKSGEWKVERDEG